MQSAVNSDGVEDLARALRDYLAELACYRAVCARHADTVGVQEAGKGVHLLASFKTRADSICSLRSACERLGSWRHSPFWPSEGRKWEERKWQALRQQATHPVTGTGMVTGIAWEGNAILVKASTDAETLALELTVPALPTPLPEFPLRVVAQTLGCLERLLPGQVAVPLPKDRPGLLSVWEYLQRAPPDTFPVGKLFSAPGAGP